MITFLIHDRHYWTGRLVGSLGSSLGVDPLAVTVVADTGRRGADTAALTRTNADVLAVDGARNAVVDLDVQLGQGVLLVHRGLRDITDGSRLNHVADGKALDGLVLRDHARAVRAADRVDVATALLVASVGSSLLRHIAVVSFVL